MNLNKKKKIELIKYHIIFFILIKNRDFFILYFLMI